MKVIGLTGGIASGKSTVSKYLSEHGFAVIDADIAARRAVDKGSTGLQQVIETFGEDIVDDNGELNRKKLGSIIFEDADKREQLNAIVHPIVRSLMDEWKNAALLENKTVIMDIPLLIENNLIDTVEAVWLVYVTEEVQIERLMKRNQLTYEEAVARIKSQLPMDDKKKYADIIIDNNGTIEALYSQLNELIHTYK